MDTSIYFKPVDTERLGLNALEDDCLAKTINTNSLSQPFKGDLQNIVADMAIIGVGNSEADEATEQTYSADTIRKEFYKLKQHRKRIKIIDLGNLQRGKTRNDTYSALAEVCSTLFQNRITPIILGGDNDMAAGNYKAYEQIGQIINIFNLDSKFDFKDLNAEMSVDNYLTYIFCNQPNYLFNYTHAAYQTYLVAPEVIDLMHQMKFEIYRLGEIQNQVEQTEPLIRNADMLIADIGAIRASDSPCSDNPHGLYGEEFCKILNFAGMSDKLTSVGIYNYDEKKDNNRRTAQIISHALWYFIEGYNWRKNDLPYKDTKNYYKFSVLMPNDMTIIFFKSKKSERWWMQVSCPGEMQEKYLRHFLVPCTFNDYQEAMEGRVPERWLLAYNKLNL